MKKLSLLFFVLFISFSFAQTKKKEIVSDPSVSESERRLAKTYPIGDIEAEITIDSGSTAQAVVNDENTIYNSSGVEVKPEFPGGIEKFYAFLGKNFQMPDEEGLKGKVYVTFVVEKDGSLTDIKVIRDIGYGTGKEAIRVLKKCPKWTPGEQNGKKVRVLYSLPITIQSAE